MHQGYYEPNKTRPNLKVITEAMATRIIFRESERVIADGVEFIKDGSTSVLKARKEVILCAGRLQSESPKQGCSSMKGTFHSPMLLELSGKHHLDDPLQSLKLVERHWRSEGSPIAWYQNIGRAAWSGG